ncbi:hypothetical protein D3C87_1237230 [compost metagenome]
MHVPEFVGRAGGHFLQAFPALIGRCRIEVAPVGVLGETRVVVLQPSLAVLRAHQRRALRPVGRDRAEAGRRHGLLRRRGLPARRLDVREPRGAHAVDELLDRPHAQRVFRHARAAVGMPPIERHLLERLRRRGPAVEPVAVAVDREGFLQPGDLQLHRATGLVLLVARVGVAADQHLGHQLGHAQVQHCAGADEFGRAFPQLLLQHQMRVVAQGAHGHHRDPEVVAALPAVRMREHAQVDRLHGPQEAAPSSMRGSGWLTQATSLPPRLPRCSSTSRPRA